MNQPAINCHCPHCQQIDQVQKISAIHTAGISTSEVTGELNTGGSVRLNREHQSELSKRFKPPEKPKETIKIEGVLGCSGIILFLSTILTIWSFIINSLLSKITVPIMVYAVIIFAIAFIIWRQNRHMVKPTLQQRLSHWQELCNIWSGTYYCHRCDIVYHPNKPDHVYSVENAGQLYNFRIGS